MKGAKSHSQTTNGWVEISGNRATDPGDTQEEASSLTSVPPVETRVSNYQLQRTALGGWGFDSASLKPEATGTSFSSTCGCATLAVSGGLRNGMPHSVARDRRSPIR